MTLGYWIEAPGRGALREVEVANPEDGELTLDAICTAISPGTERLVGMGRVPQALHASMSCRGMQGSFSLPLLYGYSFVGRVSKGVDRGRRAFVMRPHQQQVVAARDEVVWLPDNVPEARATLFPNLETARNAVWDAQILADDSTLVIGAGALGLLCAFVLAHDHGRKVALIVDSDPKRRAHAAALPWVEAVAAPEEVTSGKFSHALHTSATSAGLQLAVEAVGFEGQVVELSWYGDAAVTLQLGGTFHSQRKRILASQVGAVAPSHREDGYQARHQAVLELLSDQSLDALLSRPIPFTQAPETFAALYESRLESVCPFFTHID